MVTWNPDTSDARPAVDFENMAKKVIKKGSGDLMHTLKKSSGSTYGEFEWPEIAPLVYPTLDDSTTGSESGVEKGKKKSSLQDKKKFVDDYMDRRAQAKFVSFPLSPCALLPFWYDGN